MIDGAIDKLRAGVAARLEAEISAVIGAMRLHGRDWTVTTWWTWWGGERVHVSIVVTRGQP